MTDLAQQGNGSQPAKAFFNAFPVALTDPVTLMPCGSAINSAAAARVVILGHMRCDPHVPAFRNKILGVTSR
jgi:hypothetical protein